MSTRRVLGVVIGTLVTVGALGGCAKDPRPTSAPSSPQSDVAAEPNPEPGQAQPDGIEPSAGTVRYLALGDSLTQGIGATDLDNGTFPALLAQRWRAEGCEVELQNAGASGYTAGQVLVDEVPSIAEFKPTIITFQAGGNDIVNAVPLDEYRRSVTSVLDAASDSGAKVVVLAQNEWFRSPDGRNYGTHQAAQREQFDAALIEEADAHGAQFVDMRPLYKQQADDGDWVEDGLHPTPAAYEAWAAGLADAVPAPCR